jgi:hypothetical protein
MTEKMRQDRINQNLLKQEGTGWDVGYGMILSIAFVERGTY